jgi:serine/threonine protein kinase
MAPEVLQGVYTAQADLWSIGIITYMLLSSYKPFYSKDLPEMMDLIMRGDVRFDAAIWESISEDAKDFVTKLLVYEPNERLTGPDALKHSWIENREKLTDALPSKEILDAIDDSILNYRQTSQLKKLALTVIAHRSTTEEILQLRQVFDRFDTVKDGVLSHEEFKAALEYMNYTGEDMDTIFSSVVSAAVVAPMPQFASFVLTNTFFLSLQRTSMVTA